MAKRMQANPIIVRPTAGDDEIAEVRKLFVEYVEWLGIDLSFQEYEEELASLPGKYAPPSGRLLVACDDLAIVACVAFRRIDATRCELKRMFVRSSHRRRGIGIQLMEEAIAAAKSVGYKRMCLDTLRTMTPAMTLYKRFGFVETTPYYNNPHPNAVYFELDWS